MKNNDNQPLKNIKQKLRDLCWYKICYAEGLGDKDKVKYANIMADDILELFEKEKQEMVEKIERLEDATKGMMKIFTDYRDGNRSM